MTTHFTTEHKEAPMTKATNPFTKFVGRDPVPQDLRVFEKEIESPDESLIEEIRAKLKANAEEALNKD